MPVVSVIMPSFNHERYISEAISSVLDQTFPDFEFIIIDDCSTDGSREIIKRFADEDERIVPLFHENNMGIAKTLNQGIENSNGYYLALIASDDVWVETKLEKQIKILENNEDLVVFSEGQIIDDESNPTGETSSEKYDNSTLNGYIFEDVINSWFTGSSIILKHDNLKNIKYNENLKYLNDTQFYMDLSYRYEYHYMDESLSKYRLHGHNTSYGHIKDIEGWYKDSLNLCNYIFKSYGSELTNKAVKHIFFKTCLVPFMIGTKNDLLNRYNLIYPVILPMTFLYNTLKMYIKRRV